MNSQTSHQIILVKNLQDLGLQVRLHGPAFSDGANGLGFALHVFFKHAFLFCLCLFI